MRIYALRRPDAPVLLIGTAEQVQAQRRADAERPQRSFAGRPRIDRRGNLRPAPIDPSLIGLRVLGWLDGDSATAEGWRARSSWSAPGHPWVLASAELLNAIRAEWNPWDGADAHELGVAPLKSDARRDESRQRRLARRRRGE